MKLVNWALFLEASPTPSRYLRKPSAKPVNAS